MAVNDTVEKNRLAKMKAMMDSLPKVTFSTSFEHLDQHVFVDCYDNGSIEYSLINSYLPKSRVRSKMQTLLQGINADDYPDFEERLIEFVKTDKERLNRLCENAETIFKTIYDEHIRLEAEQAANPPAPDEEGL